MSHPGVQGDQGAPGPDSPPPPFVRRPSICRAVVFYDETYLWAGLNVTKPVLPIPAVVKRVADPADPESAVDLFVQSTAVGDRYAVHYGPGKAGCWGWPPS